MRNNFLKKNKMFRYFLEKYNDLQRSKEISEFNRKMETYLQDRNAGNGGDRLKHMLILNLLQHMEPTDEWSYRETHAGSGIYPINAHSKLLFNEINTLKETKAFSSLYWNSLKEWLNAGAPGYPGSVLLAARFLHHKIKNPGEFDIRVTESDPIALSRLSLLSGDYGVKIRADSFDMQMDWLCYGSSLLFVVDPYFYDNNAKNTTKGRFGKVHLFELLNRLSQKKGGILLIFTADPSDSPRRTYEELKNDLDGYHEIQIVRHFLLNEKQIENKNFRNYYWISIIGFGTGVEIVKNIPIMQEWNSLLKNMNILREICDSRMDEMVSYNKFQR